MNIVMTVRKSLPDNDRDEEDYNPTFNVDRVNKPECFRSDPTYTTYYSLFSYNFWDCQKLSFT